MGDILRRYLKEAVRVTRLANEAPETPETGLESDTDTMDNPDLQQGQDKDPNDINAAVAGEEDVDPNDPNAQAQPEEPQDPNRMGLIRRVPGAHLVFKRETEEGTYEELWIYNLNQAMRDELKTRREILAGTDIPVNKTQSEDGAQTYDIWTAGNAQVIHIKGLPN